MPRLARIDAPGIIHHIMIRGIERRKIFLDKKDRDNLLDRLSMILSDTKTTCYAWALMPNHAHFLFRSGEYGISKVMGRLLTGYAVSFNKKYNRHGQLFQNRYKSVICQENKYLLELVRYIHLNPLRSGIVSNISELDEYPYTGHSTLTSAIKRDWQDTDYILSFFGNMKPVARNKYLDFVKNGIDQGRRDELVGGGLIRSLGGWSAIKNKPSSRNSRIKSDERILGDNDFVSRILLQAKDKLDHQFNLKGQGYDIDAVEKKVLTIFAIKRDALYSGSRKKSVSEARSVFCFWCVRELGESMTDIAKRLGISQPAVGYAVERGENLVQVRKLDLK